jgi:enterochelin esterase family protein
VPNGFGQTNNCFWMPEARPSPLFRRGRDVPAGSVEPALFQSPRLAGGRRRARLYRSAGDGPHRFLLVLDGSDYFERARLATLADNLVHGRALPPLAILFLDNAGRARFTEYACSEALVGFVAEELLPWIADRVSLVREPGSHAVLGASLGGLAALWLGARLPETFGRVLSQAGAFRLRSGGQLALTTLLQVTARLPLRIHLDCGVYDPLLAANRAMKALLEERGYTLDYREFNAGHNYPAWREQLPGALPWLYAEA